MTDTAPVGDKSHLDTIAAAIAASDDSTVAEPPPSEVHQSGQEVTMADLMNGETPESIQQVQQPELSEHALNFLNHVPEEHRSIVAQYLQPWDAGAQRRFRQYQDELANYQSYGDPELLQKASFLYNELMEDPKRFKGILDQIINEGQPQQSRQVQPQPYSQPSFDDLDPDVVNPLQTVLSAWGNQFGQRFQTYDQQMQAMNRTLQQINERFQQEESTVAQQREESRLQEELDLLERQYGQFDQNYVLSQIAAGIDPDEAVQNYQNLVTNIKSSLGPPKIPPGPTLSGSGLPPAQPADFNQLSGKQVRELITQALEQSRDD